MIAAAFQAGGLHHPEQRLLIGMHADGLREIAVARLVLGDDFPQQRQHLEGVDVVDRPQRRRRVRKLQHHELAARLEHPTHGGQGRWLVRHVAQAKGDGDDVEGVVREKGSFSALTWAARVLATSPSLISRSRPWREHGRVDICEDYQSAVADLLGHPGGDVAGAAGDVAAPSGPAGGESVTG